MCGVITSLRHSRGKPSPEQVQARDALRRVLRQVPKLSELPPWPWPIPPAGNPQALGEQKGKRKLPTNQPKLERKWDLCRELVQNSRCFSSCLLKSPFTARI